MKAIVCWTFCVFVGLASLTPARATDNPNRPDVLVLAFARGAGQETISFTYPNAIPHSQAQRDLTALQSQLGTQFTGVHIADELPPLEGSKEKLTVVSFNAAGALENSSHGFAVEPLILAMKPYHRISMTYFEDSYFQFQGLRNYQDKFVTIEFTKAHSTYTYNILINNPAFTKLNLPTYAPDPSTLQSALASPAPTQVPAPKHHSPWVFVLIAVVAIGLGGTVYTVLSRYF